jgi:hypothetical protein
LAVPSRGGNGGTLDDFAYMTGVYGPAETVWHSFDNCPVLTQVPAEDRIEGPQEGRDKCQDQEPNLHPGGRALGAVPDVTVMISRLG